MTLTIGAEAFPWDLHDHAGRRLLDRLKGEVGVEVLGVPLRVLNLREWRGADHDPRMLQVPAGLLFHPDSARFSDTRCKPLVSPWVKGRETVESLFAECARVGFPIRAVLATSGPDLARRYPAMAAKNAFGLTSERTLCLSNPDMQAMLAGLVTDIARRLDPSSLVLERFQIDWPDPGELDFISPYARDGLGGRLLEICFCESCLQRAAASGADGPAALRSVKTQLDGDADALFGDQRPLTVVLETDPILRHYLQTQSDTLDDLLGRLASTATCPFIVRQAQGGWTPTSRVSDAWRKIGGTSTVVNCLSDPREALVVPAAFHELALRPPNRAALREPDTGAFVRGLELVAAHAVAAVDFGNVALWPEATWAAVRRAARFCRREL